MHYIFCPECGNKLIEKTAGDDGLIPYCDTCNKFWFDTFPTCVIVLIANEFNELVLLKQKYLSDKYSTFVAGYMISNENAETTAKREVKEEIGIDLEKLELTCTHWFNQKGILMIGFIAYCKKCDFKLSSEVDSAFWIPYPDVPKYLFPDSPDNTAFALYKKYIGSLNLS